METAIYCRISEDREGAALGVERQREDCQTMAERRGWHVAGVYADNDISAYSGKLRPQYRQLLQDIEAGAIKAVVVWHLDRLHRQPRELETFIDLVERHGVALASVAGEHDLGSPEGRLHARILGAVARMESEHKSRRIRRKKLELARAGKPLGGGYRPFGYEKDGITINVDEAAVLREATTRLLHGDSLRSIVLDLNSRSLFTSTGHTWIARSLKRVLLNPRNAGIVEHREAGRIKAVWEPIISEDDQARLQALFNDPKHQLRPGRPRKYLLSGLLRCGACGSRLVSVNARNSRGRAYGCPPPPSGCNHVVIVAGWLEEHVTTVILGALRRRRLHEGERPAGDDDADLDAVNADRAQLNELAAAYAARKITMSEWAIARELIEERISEATERIAARTSRTALQRILADGAGLAEQWELMPVERQRSIVAAMIDQVVVSRSGKGRYADPSRLQVLWVGF